MTRREPTTEGGFTRGRLLSAGAAAAAGAVAIGSRTRENPQAAESASSDAKILRLFLTLEQVQASFYQQAVESGRLTGELLKLAQTVSRQEGEHVASVAKRLGGSAKQPPQHDFGDAFASPERFLETAVNLEEAAIGAYVGQAPNLSRRAMAHIATLVSVEARQAAWLRDLQGVSPAPRAADPARRADDVVRELRAKGYLA